MQVNFSPYGQPGDLGRVSLNFNYKINFKDFCTKFCVCFPQIHCTLQNISNAFIIVTPWSGPSGGTCVAGCQKLELWGFAMAPHRLRVIVKLCI